MGTTQRIKIEVTDRARAPRFIAEHSTKWKPLYDSVRKQGEFISLLSLHIIIVPVDTL